MAEWSRNKVDSTTINSGNEYEKGDRVARQALNAMVNAGLYAQDFAEALADTPDTSEAGNVGTPTVEIIDNVKNGKTYKKFKFKNLKGESAIEEVTITAPASATSGNLTADQVAILQANDENCIIFNKEKYYPEDRGHLEGFLTYTHVGYENNTQWLKSITVTLSTNSWVLNIMGLYGEGLNLDGNKRIRVNTDIICSKPSGNPATDSVVVISSTGAVSYVALSDLGGGSTAAIRTEIY